MGLIKKNESKTLQLPMRCPPPPRWPLPRQPWGNCSPAYQVPEQPVGRVCVLGQIVLALGMGDTASMPEAGDTPPPSHVPPPQPAAALLRSRWW